jgi:DNA-binding MarR family transcriptional regulator
MYILLFVTHKIPCAMLSLRQAARSVTQLYDEFLRPSGLKGTQYSALRVIAAREPVSVGELSEIMVMDRTTATRNLRLLDRDALVRLEPGEDRRTRLVHLTRRGRSALEKANLYWAEAQLAVVARFGKAKFESLRDELARMTDVSRGELEARLSR